MKKGSWLVLITSIFLLYSVPVYADSGWDYDYGGGYSSDYGSSYGGYDSYDSDYGSSYGDYDSGHSGSSRVPYSFFSILMGVLGTILVPKRKDGRSMAIPEKNETEETILKNTHRHINTDKIEVNYDEVIKKYLPKYTEKKLLEDFYDTFVKVQIAWMDFDYKKLENFCSLELYDSYVADLEELKNKGQKNIMSDFSFISSNIRNIEEIDGRVVIDAYLAVSFKDYIINTDNGMVERGNSDEVVTVKYDLEFIMDLDNSKGSSYCPNCGAKITSRICEFCKSVVTPKKEHFVLNKKSIMK